MKYITYNKLLFNNTKKIEYTVDNVYDNFIVVKNTNNMLGTMTLDGTIIMPPSFYAIEPHGDLYKTKNKLKYGLINKFGVEILKPTYTVINEFINHIAIVCLDDKYYGVINDLGKIVIPTIYGNIDRNNTSFIATKDNKQIIYDNNGNVIIDDARYSYTFLSDNCYEMYDSKREKYGVITKEKILIKAKYDRIEYLNDNKFFVYKGLKRYIVDSNDKVILKLPPNSFCNNYDDSDVAIICKDYNFLGIVINNYEEYKELSGIRSIEGYHNGYAAAQKYGGTCIIINNKGENALNKKFLNATYEYAKIAFYIREIDSDEHYYLDKNLNRIAEKDDDTVLIDSNNYIIMDKINDIIIAYADKSTYFISNDKIINKIDSSFTHVSTKEGYILLSKNYSGELYYMLCDLLGNIIIPLTKDEILILSKDTIIIDNKLINLNNEYINYYYQYKLDIYDSGIKEYTFETSEQRDNYINNRIEFEKNNDLLIEKLEDEVERLYNTDYDDYLNNEENKKMIKSLDRWLK